jgi:Ca-activated chloride channel family protein
MNGCREESIPRSGHPVVRGFVRFLVTFSVATALFSQQKQDPTPEFSVTSNLVRFLVSVRDANGAIVSNLEKSSFQLFDNDTEQTISVFEKNTSLPLSIAILVDTSASTRKDLGYETQSILHFMRAVKRAGNPQDALAVYSFNWQVRLEVGFTRNEARAERSLRMLHGEGGTSLYDAVYLVSQDLADRDGRHVFIIVTDGGDTTSYKQYADAVKASIRADAIIYPVVVVPIPSDAGRNLGGEHALDTMARSTGGRTFNPSGAEELDQAFARILSDLRTQYLLAYRPVGTVTPPDRFHRVKVVVRQPAYKVTTRSGYYEP